MHIYIYEIQLYAYYDYYVCVYRNTDIDLHTSAHICTHLHTSALILYMYISFIHIVACSFIFAYITLHHITLHYTTDYIIIHCIVYVYTMLDIIHVQLPSGKRLHNYGFFTIF
jgi:hypothetical protein